MACWGFRAWSEIIIHFLELPELSTTDWEPKQKKCIGAQLWDQGVGRLSSFWGPRGRICLGFLSTYLLVVCCKRPNSITSRSITHPLPACSQGLPPLGMSVSVCSFPLFIRHQSYWISTTPMNHLSSDPISKYHILRF